MVSPYIWLRVSMSGDDEEESQYTGPIRFARIRFRMTLAVWVLNVAAEHDSAMAVWCQALSVQCLGPALNRVGLTLPTARSNI